MEFAGLTARATSFIRRLQLHPRLFDQFQQVMKDYSTEKLNVGAVVSQLDIIFRYHPDFLTEYRIFLSTQLRATLPPPSRSPNKKCVTEPDMEILKDCIDFMNNVQKRFADEWGVVVRYMDIMRELTQGKICDKEACNAIVKIFGHENQDLVDGFEWLLLTKKKTSSPSPSTSDDEIKARYRREDEMYELDMNLSRLKTTVDSANRLMYSDIITRLREDPRRVLPEILEKLESEKEVLIKKQRYLHEKKKIISIN